MVLGDNVNDNGTQITSKEYKEFVIQWRFTLTTSGLQSYYPRGDEDGSSHQMALCELRATPLDSKTPSSGELLYNRQMKITLTIIMNPPHKSEAIEHHFKLGKTTVGMMPMPKRNQTWSPPSQFGYRPLLVVDGSRSYKSKN